MPTKLLQIPPNSSKFLVFPFKSPNCNPYMHCRPSNALRGAVPLLLPRSLLQKPFIQVCKRKPFFPKSSPHDGIGRDDNDEQIVTQKLISIINWVVNLSAKLSSSTSTWFSSSSWSSSRLHFCFWWFVLENHLLRKKCLKCLKCNLPQERGDTGKQGTLIIPAVKETCLCSLSDLFCLIRCVFSWSDLLPKFDSFSP